MRLVPITKHLTTWDSEPQVVYINPDHVIGLMLRRFEVEKASTGETTIETLTEIRMLGSFAILTDTDIVQLKRQLEGLEVVDVRS